MAGLGYDPGGSAIVSSIIKIGEVLELDVVAEGVETASQRQTLQALGCPLAQGYHFGRPERPSWHCLSRYRFSSTPQAAGSIAGSWPIVVLPRFGLALGLR